MCNNSEHEDIMQDNACCLNDQCNWHGPYMDPHPGWWIHADSKGGTAHCPKCGHGKYIHADLVHNPLFKAAQQLLEGGDAQPAD